MKRKTNLFYNFGPDSKYLSFSCYSDSLTGNYLSTTTKLFPSAFICLNIPNLNSEESKTDFIKNYLIAYFENKIATIYDSDYKNESKPLSYLIDTIMKFDENSKITYIGSITEQDYNGVFTDTICIIDGNDCKKANIEAAQNNTSNSVQSDTNLYGWYVDNVYKGPSTYSDLAPKFDTENSYLLASTYDLKIADFTESDTNIEFNVIIPLFDMVYNNDEYINVLESDDSVYILNSPTKYAPLGIWFADKSVSIEVGTKYGQSWSLSIGSQFKPLPTSGNSLSDIKKTAVPEAFTTFAQILAKQTALYTEISKLNKTVLEMQNRINELESKINTI